jgi:hypothetical protein
MIYAYISCLRPKEFKHLSTGGTVNKVIIFGNFKAGTGNFLCMVVTFDTGIEVSKNAVNNRCVLTNMCETYAVYVNGT